MSHPSTTTTRRRGRAAAAALAATLLLAACGDAGAVDDTSTDATATDDAASAGSGSGELGLTDGWAIAAEDGMSSAFGTLVNAGSEDVHVVSAISENSPDVELHETVADEDGEMVMRETDDGFVVPSGGELVLEPGGNHLMLMDVVEPLLAGDQLTVTLTLDDGSTLDLVLDVRDFTGGHEHYEGSGDHGEHGDHGSSGEETGGDETSTE